MCVQTGVFANSTCFYMQCLDSKSSLHMCVFEFLVQCFVQKMEIRLSLQFFRNSSQILLQNTPVWSLLCSLQITLPRMMWLLLLANRSKNHPTLSQFHYHIFDRIRQSNSISLDWSKVIVKKEEASVCLIFQKGEVEHSGNSDLHSLQNIEASSKHFKSQSSLFCWCTCQFSALWEYGSLWLTL